MLKTKYQINVGIVVMLIVQIHRSHFVDLQGNEMAALRYNKHVQT